MVHQLLPCGSGAPAGPHNPPAFALPVCNGCKTGLEDSLGGCPSEAGETSCESALWVKVHRMGKGQRREHMDSHPALCHRGRVGLILKIVVIPGFPGDISFLSLFRVVSSELAEVSFTPSERWSS